MKFSKFAKYYAIATQGIFSMIVLLVIGYFIGVWIDSNSFWPGLLASLGAIIGLVSFVCLLLKLLKQEDKKDAETRPED